MNLICPRRAGATLQNLGLAGREPDIPCPDVDRVGRAFRMGGVSESVSRNLPLEWDAVSRWQPWGKCVPESWLETGWVFPMGRKRKMRPGICAQSGMRFPVEGLRGKCVPESTLEMGRRFPMRHSTENTSQKWPLSWDKISAASRILKNETRRWRK